ncbi:MAG: hypothetical protein ACRCXE_00910 [Metamycoplasmataceae bacterium]
MILYSAELQRVITVNGYRLEDIILWTFGLLLSVISVVFSVLSYYFANKSTKLITDLMEKTWVTSETDKFFFVNMKDIKHNNNRALMLLNSDAKISYEDYVAGSLGTRIIHINWETINSLLKTKFRDIITTYIQDKKKCDEMFFKAVPIEKITSLSKEMIPEKERQKLIQYHESIAKFVSYILSEYTKLTME